MNWGLSKELFYVMGTSTHKIKYTSLKKLGEKATLDFKGQKLYLIRPMCSITKTNCYFCNIKKCRKSKFSKKSSKNKMIELFFNQQGLI